MPRRAVDGVLLLDKPLGITSQGAVTRVKHLFGAAKAGHTGTLDPMATGLLPVALGEATKFSHALLDADKTYRARVRLGLVTTTGDLEGEVISRQAVAVDRPRVEAVLGRFRGAITQIPPMYSALKHGGKALYTYARAGVEVPRQPRQVTIGALELERAEGDELMVDVTCSKGTYIRVLAEDIGKALGCGACLSALRRTRVGAFVVEDAIGLDRLAGMDGAERALRLLPVDALVAALPRLELDTGQVGAMLHGRAVEHTRPPTGLVRLYDARGAFLGLAEGMPDGRVVPRRLLAVPARTGS
jgi:tRNA pseudouridine55 synthase